MRYQTVAKLFALTYGIKIGQQLAGRAAQDASGQSLISVGGIRETSIITSLFLIMNQASAPHVVLRFALIVTSFADAFYSRPTHSISQPKAQCRLLGSQH